MADYEESPLIKALPPESDYLTYLTIIEYNLTRENLPILHQVLQDETLAVNIGWDLIHLLLPFLPDSEPCLQIIARLGNPREVILKVTESLRLIEYEFQEDEAAEDAFHGSVDLGVRTGASDRAAKSVPTVDDKDQSGSLQTDPSPQPLPLPVTQFVTLLALLSTLHARIKTKYPSRFLSTTLQAILASFSNATTHREEMVQAIVKTVKALAGIQRPTLPARKSSGMISTTATVSNAPAADPEGTTDGEIDAAERLMQTRLIQSFVTHITEEYMLEIPALTEDVPGMAWCSRIMEKLHPERIIPETKTMAERFQREEKLHRRIDAVGQLVTLAQDLKLTDDTLLAAASTDEKAATLGSRDEEDPPVSAEDIPLSRSGALLLYTARQASSILYDTHSAVDDPLPLPIFPTHQGLLRHTLSSSSPAAGTGTLGNEPEALLDAVLALGLLTLEHDSIGEPSSDEQFNEYLQTTALLSSNCPSPNLRGHAHYLTSTILRSHPDENVRLAFIRDTLEHCPFENLKVSAVGWIKGEIIEANPPHPIDHHHPSAEDSEAGYPTSVFATPIALDSLAPFLFPALHVDLLTAPMQEAWQTHQLNLSFYLASLNFAYLLLCAKHLHERLDIADMWKDHDVGGSFLEPLRAARKRFEEAMVEGGELAEEGRDEERRAELGLVEETVERVSRAVRLLNKTG